MRVLDTYARAKRVKLTAFAKPHFPANKCAREETTHSRRPFTAGDNINQENTVTSRLQRASLLSGAVDGDSGAAHYVTDFNTN